MKKKKIKNLHVRVSGGVNVAVQIMRKYLEEQK